MMTQRLKTKDGRDELPRAEVISDLEDDGQSSCEVTVEDNK